MASLKYWVWLSSLRGLSAASAAALLERFGNPERIYLADLEELAAVPGLTPGNRRAVEDKSLVAADKILGDCDRLGIGIVTLTDAAYPARLAELNDPPVLLYTRGRMLAFDDEPVIGVVGTRTPTAYGVQSAERLGLELARHGAVVISGGARGLDSAALRGALTGGGQVAAVLGGGVDVVYPRENYGLFQDIMAVGTLLSEYPPGTETLGANFPIRNRIISGLSVGVLAVEAAMRSGTLITTRLAGEQNRDVFALPGPVGNPASQGTNWLIQSNQAKLVTCGWDIMEEYRYQFPARIRHGTGLTEADTAARLEAVAAPVPAPVSAPPPSKKEVDKTSDRAYIDWKDYQGKLTDDQRDVLAMLGEKTLNPDELVEGTQIPARRVASALTLLELEGLVRREPAGRFSAAALLRFE